MPEKGRGRHLMASEMMTPLALLIAAPSRPTNFNLQVPVACPEGNGIAGVPRRQLARYKLVPASVTIITLA
jgi:hypothetical protein